MKNVNKYLVSPRRIKRYLLINFGYYSHYVLSGKTVNGFEALKDSLNDVVSFVVIIRIFYWDNLPSCISFKIAEKRRSN